MAVSPSAREASATPGFLRGFPVHVDALKALDGWTVQREHSPQESNQRRRWIARKDSLRCAIDVRRFGIFTKLTYGLIGSSMYSLSRPIPSLGAKTDGMFHRANFICKVRLYEVAVEEKVDWMSWPQPRLTERRLQTPVDAFPVAKALDRQIMVAAYSQRLFIVSLQGMAIVLFARRRASRR